MFVLRRPLLRDLIFELDEVFWFAGVAFVAAADCVDGVAVVFEWFLLAALVGSDVD